MWDFAISLALNLLIAYLMPKPKQPGPQRYNLGDFSYPTADETRAIPLGFGTFKVAGNLIWFGDYAADEVKKKVRSFPPQYQPLGYRYKVGMWMTLCAAPADELLEIRVGERVVWSGTQVLSKTGVTDVAVNASWTTTENQPLAEGINGTFRFFNQRADVTDPAWQPLPNTYMTARLGAGKVPAYPNMLHVVWLGPSEGGKGFCTVSNQLDTLTFVLRRKPDVSEALRTSQNISFPVSGSLSDPATRAAVKSWIDSKALVEGDANPVLVELEALTSRVPGIGPRLSGDALELESFLRAADRAYSDGLGTSFTWEQSRPVSDLVADLNALVGGFTELNDRTGQLRKKLARPEDSPAYTFDASNIIDISSFTRVSVDEAPNEVVVPFIDRNLNWTSREQSATNEAGFRAAGAVVSKRIEHLGVTRSALASILATRALSTVSASVLNGRWRAFIEPGVVLRPGDLVVLQHPKHGGLRVRVDAVQFGSWDDRLSVEVEGAQDMFRNGSPALGYTPMLSGGITTGTTPAGAAGVQVVLRAPGALTDDQADHMLYAISPGDVSQLSCRVGWASTDSPTYPGSEELEYAPDGPEYPLSVYGTLTAGLDWSQTGSVAITLAVPNATALANVLSRLSTGVPAVIAASTAAFNDSAPYLHEFVRITGASITGTNTATLTISGRGLYDTWPQRWLAGAHLVLLAGAAIDPVPLTTAACTDLFGNGPVLRSFPGVGMSRVWAKYKNGTKTSASAYGYLMLSADSTNGAGVARGTRPVVPGKLKLDGSFGAYAPTDSLPTISKSGRSTLPLTWVNRGYGSTAGDWLSPSEAVAAGHEVVYNIYRAASQAIATSDTTNAWSLYRSGRLDGSVKQLDLETATLPAGCVLCVCLQVVEKLSDTVDMLPAVPALQMAAPRYGDAQMGRKFFFKIGE